MAEEPLMQSLCVRALSGEPGGDGRLPVALRRVQPRKDPALQPGQRARWRSAGKGFSDDRKACSAWK